MSKACFRTSVEADKEERFGVRTDDSQIFPIDHTQSCVNMMPSASGFLSKRSPTVGSTGHTHHCLQQYFQLSPTSRASVSKSCSQECQLIPRAVDCVIYYSRAMNGCRIFSEIAFTSQVPPCTIDWFFRWFFGWFFRVSTPPGDQWHFLRRPESHSNLGQPRPGDGSGISRASIMRCMSQD